MAFDATGNKIVSASTDGTARLYNTMTGACLHVLSGHEGEISKVAFNPHGSKVITASSDKTCRLWDVETGDCMQSECAQCTCKHSRIPLAEERERRARSRALGSACADANIMSAPPCSPRSTLWAH